MGETVGVVYYRLTLTSLGDQTPDVLLFRLAESAYHTTLTKDYGRTSKYGYITSYIHSYAQTIYHKINQTITTHQLKDGEHRYILNSKCTLYT